VTINDLRINISLLKKRTKANLSKQGKDKEAGSSKIAKRKKRKAPPKDFDAKA